MKIFKNNNINNAIYYDRRYNVDKDYYKHFHPNYELSFQTNEDPVRRILGDIATYFNLTTSVILFNIIIIASNLNETPTRKPRKSRARTKHPKPTIKLAKRE